VKWQSGGNSVRLFEDTVGAFSQAHYGALEVVLFVFPLLIVRKTLVCPWCDRSFILREIPAFNVMMAQDASIIRGFCLVELLFRLYILFRVIFLYRMPPADYGVTD
jgi:hypothetical protein